MNAPYTDTGTNLITVPDDRLSNVCEELWVDDIPELTDQLDAFIVKMYDVMEKEGGVGLAAPQIGGKDRIIVIKLSDWKEGLTMINPVITACTEKVETEGEGCLSVPGSSVWITRPAGIGVKWQTNEGDIERGFTGLAARVIQHEVDHLDGITIYDKMNRQQKKAYAKFMRSNKR